MNQFIPLEKRSKKEQRVYHKMQRRDWNGVNPVTRTMQDAKAYDRKKQKSELRKLITE